MPEAKETAVFLAITSQGFPVMATNTLKRQGCRIENINTQYRQITASDIETYPGRQRWELKYDILISWKTASKQGREGIEIDVSIADRRNTWAQSFCKKRLDSLVSGFLEDSKIAKEPPERSTLYGSARFATEEDLRKAGYIDNAVDPQRLLLAPWGDPDGDDVISVPQAQTSWHALICGPTGAGKSSGFFIPNLIGRYGTSAIVTEATAGIEPAELYVKTAGWRAYHGNQIYVFNPTDMASTRINPIDAVVRAAPHERVAAADSLANLLIINTTPPEAQRADPIWDKTERQLLAIFIMHAVESDPELSHFGAIRRLLTTSEKKLEQMLFKSPSTYAAQEFTAFCEHSSENFRHGAFAGLLTRLNSWTSESIIRLTQTTDLDVEELKHELFTFYLSVPSRKGHLKPIASLVFNYLIDLALESYFDYPLSLILDEFTNFGYIPGIDEALSIIRRRELSCVLGIQDYKQLESVYKRDKASIIVSQLGTRIFFRPRQFHTAKEVSDGLGHQTITDEQLSDVGHIQVRQIGRPLLTPSELMELKNDQVLIMTPSTPPILCQRFTYETFPVPPGLPPPERREHPVLTEYIGGRREHPVAPEALTQANDPDPEEDEPEQYSEKVQTEPEAAPIKQTADDDEPYIP
jgi:type IV secretion system protein VirD4